MAASQEAGFLFEGKLKRSERFRGAADHPSRPHDVHDIPGAFDRINGWPSSSKTVKCTRLKKPSTNPKAFQDENGVWWRMGEICMASASRIWGVKGTFRLVIGCYEQKGLHKRLFKAFEFIITPAVMRTLRGNVPLSRVLEWDERMTRFRKGGPSEAVKARRTGRACLNGIEKDYPNCLLRLRQKIDSKKQRRLQCCLFIQDLMRPAKGRFIPDDEMAYYGFNRWPWRVTSGPRTRTKREKLDQPD